MQSIQDSVKEVSLWVAVIVLTFQVREVLKDIRSHLCDLRIDDLQSQLWPVWDFPGWHVLLQQHLLLSAHDVLKELQSSGSQGGEQIPY